MVRGGGILYNNLPSYTPNIFTMTYPELKIKKGGGNQLTPQKKYIYIFLN